MAEQAAREPKNHGLIILIQDHDRRRSATKEEFTNLRSMVGAFARAMNLVNRDMDHRLPQPVYSYALCRSCRVCQRAGETVRYERRGLQEDGDRRTAS